MSEPNSRTPLETISYSEVLRLIGQYGLTENEIFELLLKSVLVAVGQTTVFRDANIMFSHRVFHEYMIASALCRRGDSDRIRSAHTLELEYQPTFDLIADALLIAVSASFLFLYIPNFCKGVFGRELLIRAGECEVSADSVPDFWKNISICTLTQTEETKIHLRHKLYDHDHCAATIAQWIKQSCKY